MVNEVLIVCLGNICRSPMAEQLLAARCKGFPNRSITSAGLQALVGKPADPLAQEIMHQRGFDLSQHRARQLTVEQLLSAELILTMSTAQKEQICSKLPFICGKVHRLGQWDNFDIPDPYGRPKLAFEQCFTLIEQGINRWYHTLWN